MNYFLATNKTNVFHYGPLVPGATVQTGQPFLFEYENKEQLKNALQSYGQKYIEPLISSKP